MDFLLKTMRKEELESWMIFVDGLSNNEGSGVGVVLIAPQGEEIKLIVRLQFRTSNNEAECKAL